MTDHEQIDDWLDRLILDEALGSLGPDMRRLLLAYAEDHPEVGALRAEARQVALLARDAMEGMPAQARSPHPRPRAERVSPRPWMAVAAAALIGLGLGLLLGRPHDTRPRHASESAAPVVVLPARQIATAGPAGWNARAWYQKARTERRHESAWSGDRRSREALVRSWRISL